MRFSVGLSAFALGAVLAAAPVLGASINIGGNGGLLGGGGGNGGLLGGGGNGGVLGTGLLAGDNSQSGDLNVSVNGVVGTSGSGATGNGLLSTSGDGALLNLFGDGQQTANATINLGSGSGSGSGNTNVLLDLFGNGGNTGQTSADISVGGLGGGLPAVGTGGVPSDITLNLFGDGSSVTPVGSPSGGGGVGTGGGSVGGSGAGAGTIGASGGGIKLASIDARAGAGCFSPNANQLATLAGRHSYGSGTVSAWAGVTAIKVIPTGICKSALHDISAQTNISALQGFIGADAALKSQLAQWGHTPGDVIAVDRQGSTLIVYVG